nr:uncharacterized protein LOC111995573 [Quercus suber]
MINRPQQSGFRPKTRGSLRIQEPEAQAGEVNVTFKEPVHRIVDKIKNKPYFRWLNKIGGQEPYYRAIPVIRDHLRQLAKAVYLKEFVIDARDRGTGQGTPQRGNPLPPPLGIIEVIHAASKGLTAARKKGVLIVVPVEGSSDTQPPRKKIKLTQEPINFDDNDLEGTIQPHDDALVVMAQISGFLLKRVMINQERGAEVMYPDLFRGLGLRDEDILKYNTPLVRFDGKVVIPKGQISLPINMEGKEVVVTFIVVASFSPYTAILERPWIHTMGAVPSTLHVKAKFPTKKGIAIVRGSQQMARQCLVAIVN